MVFKHGDHVVRIRPKNWLHGDRLLTVVECDSESVLFEEISGAWETDKFELAQDDYQVQNESPVPAAQGTPSLPENSFPEIEIPKQVRTGERVEVPHDYDLLKKQVADQQAEIESLKRERDELNKRLQEPVNTTPRDCIPVAAIECMINTLSGVLLANGIKPREQRCIYETSNWLAGVQP